MTDVKICGLASSADLEVCNAAGARWAGFVFYPPSPRYITLETAQRISSDALEKGWQIERVALVVDADNETIKAICSALRPHMIQCHGNESPERVAAIKTMTGLPVMKAVRVAKPVDIENSMRYDDIADRLLFDAAPPGASLPGGTGHGFDPMLAKTYTGSLPWMLAGGLDETNVAAAIAASGAHAVDVSSGVERTPGVKDHEAIRRFIAAAMPLQGKNSQGKSPI